MPLTVTWADPERTIILVWGNDTWTWHDWQIALDQMVEMAQSTARHVDFIYGSAPGTKLPIGQPASPGQRALRIMPENTGSHVIVRDKAFARLIMSVFLKSQNSDLHSHFRVAPTLDAAHAFIHQHRQESGSSFVQ